MKKQVIPFFLLWAMLFVAQFAHAQYGNEWINYSKTYYKFKVAADGVYRIPFSTIQNAGLSSQVASGFKLFHKGVEVPIYTTTNGTLSNSDYIEFFGEKNTGAYDTQLYEQAEWQLNKYVSMFSDTISYFLVWDNTTIGKRYVNQANNVSNPPAAETFFMHTLTNAYRNVHIAGNPFRLGGANHWFADFEDGEGFGSTDINAGTSLEINMPTTGRYSGPGATAANLTIRAAGRSQEIGIINEHHINIAVNDVVYVNTTYDGYENTEYNTEVFLSDITNNNTLVTFTSVGDIANDEKNTVAYASLTYPRNFDFAGANRFRFKLANSQQKYLEITNFAGGTAPVLYDLTNNLRLVPVVDNGVYKFLLPQGLNPSAPRDLYLFSTDTPCAIGCSFPVCNPTQCYFFTVPTLTATQFTNYAAAANQGNYIIITHRSLRQGGTDWVQEYANYRESAAGGNYNVMIADIDDLYDQFAAGIPKHPLSIRKFLDYAIDNWNIDPRFVFLIGKSVSYNNFAGFYYNANLVPTFGFTPSDNMLSVEGVGSYLPRIATGRLSAVSANQVRDYYEKMLEYETEVPCTREAREWMKNVLHISAAKTNAEHEDFTQILADFGATISGPQYGGNVTNFDYCAGFCDAIPTQTDFPEFETAFNNGASLVTLFGHAVGSTAWYFPNMHENPSDFSNYGKYPFIISNSCFVGNVHQYSFSDPNNSLAEKYVLADGLGSIGYLATVFFGIPSYLNEFSGTLYNHLSVTDYGQPIGSSFVEVLNDLYNNNINDPNYLGTKVTAEEFTFVGDPAVVLAGSFANPEFIVENNSTTTDVQVFNHDTGAPIVGNNLPAGVNSIDIVVHVSNIGQILDGNLSIRIDRQLNGGTAQIAAQQLVANPTSEGTYTFTIAINPASFTGLNTFTVVIDALNQYIEDCEDNNQVSLNLNVQDPNCAGLPQPQFSVPSTFCVGDPSVTLTSNIAGTVFSGDGVSGNAFTPSTPGTKTIVATYTDSNTGCVVTNAVTVTVNAIPSAAFTANALSTCVGNTVTLTPTNFNQNYAYNWGLSGGVGSGNNQNYNVVWNTPGIKNVTLVVVNGDCQTEQTVQINVQAPLATPNVSCANTTLNSVTFGWNAISGATSYQIYTNGNLSQTTNNTGYTVSGLATGEDVSITVVAVGTGICGNSPASAPQTCSAQDCSPLTLSIPQLENQTTFCSDDNIVSLTSSQNGGVITVNGVTTNILNPSLLSTTQPTTVTISYVEGACDYQESYSVVVNSAPNAQVTGSSQVCPGGSIVLSAGDFESYQWSNGATTPTITVTTAGTYSVTVTNDVGCSDNAAKTITTAPEPTLDVTSGNGGTQICAGSSLTLSATDGFSNYNWSGAAGVGSTITIFGAGTYTVTATDIIGCQWSESITITSSSVQQPVITLNGQTANPAICGGSTNLLDAGSGYASYSWSNGDQTQTSTISQAGVYTVTVTNGAGCNAVAAFEVTNATVSAPSLTATATEICNDPSTITAQAGYEAYSWSNGGATNTITVTEAGVYTVTVTQAGCQATQSIVITTSAQSLPLAAFVLTSEPTVCSGASIFLDNQSENAESYLWTVTNTTTNSTQTSTEAEPSFSLTEEGSYSITLQVDAVCGSSTDSEQLSTAVTVANAPSIDVTANLTTLCPGEEVELTAQASTGATLLWFVNNQATDNTASTFVHSPLQTTVYTVRAMNSIGCMATDSVQVTIDTACELPNAITPNGDNYNENWRIPLAYTDPNLKVEIFNRWGQLIWNTTAYNNDTDAFKGKNNNGDEVAEGTYYYVITPSTSAREVLSGHITVLR